ncbi:MAG: hypothetical protein GX070_00840 [Alcaligenaceae bacterium]|nr:hypothetical protein [Alcaligenaceae bacterium]
MQTSLTSHHSAAPHSHSANNQFDSPMLDSAMGRFVQACLFLAVLWGVTGFVMGWFPALDALVSGFFK